MLQVGEAGNILTKYVHSLISNHNTTVYHMNSNILTTHLLRKLEVNGVKVDKTANTITDISQSCIGDILMVNIIIPSEIDAVKSSEETKTIGNDFEIFVYHFLVSRQER